MARARMMPASWATDEDLAMLSPLARLLYYHLHSAADRLGRLEDRPRRIRVHCLPYDDVDTDGLLSELAAARKIVRYSVDGERFIEIPAFLKTQRPHVREADSEIPPPPENTYQGSVEHQPSTDLGSAQHSPRSPESVNGVGVGVESVPVPVSESCPKTETESPLANGAKGKERADRQTDKVRVRERVHGILQQRVS